MTTEIREFIGRKARVIFSTNTTKCTGDLDEGEDEINLTGPTEEREFYIQGVIFEGDEPKFLIARSLEETPPQEGLVPIHYAFSPLWEIGYHYAEAHQRVKRILGLESEVEITLPERENTRVWDGVQHVSVSTSASRKYSPQEIQDYQDFPLLEKKGCQYDPKTKLITGHLEQLVPQS